MLCSAYFLLALSAASVQELNSYAYFEIENREAIWSYIYEDQPYNDEQLRDRLIDYLKYKPWVSKIETEGNTLIVDVDQYIIEYKKAGSSYMNTPLIIRSGRWGARIQISIQNGRYRAIAHGLHYKMTRASSPTGRVHTTNLEEVGTLSDEVLTESRYEFKKSKLKALHLISASLKENFTLPKEQPKRNEDW